MSRSTTAAQLGFALLGTIPPTASPSHLILPPPRSSSFSRKREKPVARLSLRECYQIPSVSKRSFSFYVTDRGKGKKTRMRARERERRSERTFVRARQGSHSLHNCSELNSSLVAPPEITLLLLFPLLSARHYFLRGSRSFRVYYVLVVAALVARSAPTTFVNELGPSSSGFC